MKIQRFWVSCTLLYAALLAGGCSAADALSAIHAQATITELFLSWAPQVHTLLLRQAFEHEPMECLVAMIRGNGSVDALGFQDAAHAHMHAMRGPNQSVEEAAEKMQVFIEENFALARQARTQELACFYRGVALHPVMDASSPVHSGFQVWDPIDPLNWKSVLRALLSPYELHSKLSTLLKHGAFSPATTLEDANALYAHPDLLEQTLQTIQDVDRAQFER